MTQRQRNRPKKLPAEYLVGLTDGEGCFYINLRPPRGIKSKQSTIEFHFYLKLKGDHFALLKKVKKTFGCGGIYHQKEKRKNHSECYRFEINSRKDIKQILIPFFEKYPLQGPKIKDFLIFKKIFSMVQKGNHLKENGIVKIQKLKQGMNLGVRRVWKIRSLGGNVKEC